MTARRYFYTCPLKAAYMAKYFGMKFLPHTVHVKRLGWYDGQFVSEIDDSAPFYIHPDSLDLLEPQDGDVVEFAGEFDTIYDTARLQKYCERYIARPKNMVAGEHHFCNIIQRNGLAFHWPESEEA